MKRLLPILLIALAMLFTAGCRKNKVQNPIADLDTKQPDKVLFDRAMEALKRNKYDVARLTLQTLINTYPDSEYVARAKLAVGDSWYAEGTSAGLAQAEIEYKDFITFFPNMPEAAEAQLKVANIHYRQMEKPDRDYTHAKRAEEEYKQLLLQFPDSKLVAEAKQRLLEVQEVLAEREFRIGRFYYMRGSVIASIARLKSLTDGYPLYSQAGEALFMLGNAYEQEAAFTKNMKQLPEAARERLTSDILERAAEAYARIITRYPVTARVEEAKLKLQALGKPVPTPTAEAIALNKAEEESRQSTGRFGRLMKTFRRSPDVAMATKVGEPTLVEPKQTSAPEVAREAERMMIDAMKGSGTEATGEARIETLPGGLVVPGPNQPPPSSSETQTERTGETQAPLPPPTQVNDAEQEAPPAAEATSSSSDKDKKDDKEVSSSKKKKKKGLRKIIPF